MIRLCTNIISVRIQNIVLLKPIVQNTNTVSPAFIKQNKCGIQPALEQNTVKEKLRTNK